MPNIPNNADLLLRRKPLAEALTAFGYPVSPLTLATMVTRGGGPPYRLFGRIPLYRWGDAIEWAEGRLGPLRASSSDGAYRTPHPTEQPYSSRETTDHA